MYLSATIMLLAPLVGALIIGIFCMKMPRRFASMLAIITVSLSFISSLYLLSIVMGEGFTSSHLVLYQWASISDISISIGFLIDRLSILMSVVVTFVSLMVHVYTIGYMHDDKGFNRFFCYLNLFTFAMLSLVMADNLLQLFFGWEGVGLASYLLIGFWFNRSTAIAANLKAFVVNRVGDFAFILGIALLFTFSGSLNFSDIFTSTESMRSISIPVFGMSVDAASLAALLLFIGAMAKSAQMPLHVWLPDSMEGPTPISALIHAATMVTAGIYLVARMSPLYSITPEVLQAILVIGTLTSFMMGLVGIVQYDIKKIIAYSTLSQLGLMVAALGLGLYNLAIFHLLTHAFFKAMLFLGAGSVIHALHHEQDIRKMGGLRKKMPITFYCMLIGSLSLSGIPGFAGFYSKDLIIHSLHTQSTLVAHLCYYSLLLGVIITALYSFRLLFIVFYGKENYSPSHEPHESKMVITIPLILLAIPSVIIGHLLYGYLNTPEFLAHALVLPADFVGENLRWQELYTGIIFNPAFYAGLIGITISWFLYIKSPQTAATIKANFSTAFNILYNKFYIDELYVSVFVVPVRKMAQWLWNKIDIFIIDGLMVNSTARIFMRLGGVLRKIQTGFVHHYIYVFILSFTVITGLLIVL